MGIKVVLDGEKEHEREWLKSFLNNFDGERVGLSSKVEIKNDYCNIMYKGNNTEFVFLDSHDRPVAWLQPFELLMLYEFYLYQEFGDEYFIMEERDE